MLRNIRGTRTDSSTAITSAGRRRRSLATNESSNPNTYDDTLKAISSFVPSILLKNLFTYLSFYILTPMRNGVIYRLREEVFQKILQMPIGYFTERKYRSVRR